MIYKTIYKSPVGELYLTSDGENLTGVLFHKEKDLINNSAFEECNGDNGETYSLTVFKAASSWLDRYFAGEKPDINELPLAPEGSEFRLAVWEILKKIPYGEVMTYGDIAKEMAVIRGKKKMSAQAVGGAVGNNPISVIIPCHRVVGAGGNLTGFGGGIDVKVKLLQHENADMTGMYIPKKGTKL